MTYLFQNTTAFNPYTGKGVPNATGQVFAMSDTAFSTPLTVTLLSSGLRATELISDQYSQLPGFDAGDHLQVRFKSGDFTKILNTSDPLPGPVGPSAYAAAAGSGYPGTEAEYNAALADVPNLVTRAEIAEQAAIDAAGLIDAPSGAAVEAAIKPGGAAYSQLAHAIDGSIETSVYLIENFASKSTQEAVDEGRLSVGSVDSTIRESPAVQKKLDAGSPPSKYVEGVPLYSMGHSYTMYPYPYGTKYTGEYYARVKERLQLGALWAKGRSATHAIDNFGRMLSANYDGGSGKWTPNAYGICVIQNTMNELGSGLASDAVFRGMWEHGVRSQVQLMRSKSILSAADMTAVGNWANLNAASIASVKGYNLTARFSDGAGSSLSTVVSGDECSIVGYINPSTYGAQDIEVLVNGTVRATFTCKGAKHATQVDAVTQIVEVLTPVAFRMKGLNAWAGTSGNKTVLVRRKTGVSAENIFITAVILPKTAPPMIFLVKEPPRAGSGAGTYAANIAYYNSRLDAIATEYDNVFTVDFAPDWDNTRMIGSLDVTGGSFHPNDIGHSLMADHLTNAITQRVTSWVDGVVVL